MKNFNLTTLAISGNRCWEKNFHSKVDLKDEENLIMDRFVIYFCDPFR